MEAAKAVATDLEGRFVKRQFLIHFGLIAVFALSACSAVPSLVPKVLRPVQENEGPCPVALVLWDASRKVQIGTPETYNNVGFTGEILTVRSLCVYRGADPIVVDLEIDFAFGRGPAAIGSVADYPYFVSVTRKDRAVIAKESFQLPITFKGDEQIVHHTEKLYSITIPRKTQDTSGANFEIIVGFDLNADELAFARSGKRFRVDAGSH